jgi:uncharacterized protein
MTLIVETIITSMDATGNVHITPFGVREENGLVIISPFKPSTTLENIVATKTAVMNLTDDVRVFAGALTKKFRAEVVAAEKIQGFRLVETLAHKELALEKIVEDDVRPQLWMRVAHEQNHQPFKGFNRAQSAVIELAVLASRLSMLPKEKIMQEKNYLQIAMDKTAGEREWQAWGWLNEKIDNFYAAIDGENFV